MRRLRLRVQETIRVNLLLRERLIALFAIDACEHIVWFGIVGVKPRCFEEFECGFRDSFLSFQQITELKMRLRQLWIQAHCFPEIRLRFCWFIDEL